MSRRLERNHLWGILTRFIFCEFLEVSFSATGHYTHNSRSLAAFSRARPAPSLASVCFPKSSAESSKLLISQEHLAGPYSSEILRQVFHLSSGPVPASRPSFASAQFLRGSLCSSSSPVHTG